MIHSTEPALACTEYSLQIKYKVADKSIQRERKQKFFLLLDQSHELIQRVYWTVKYGYSSADKTKKKQINKFQNPII